MEINHSSETKMTFGIEEIPDDTTIDEYVEENIRNKYESLCIDGGYVIPGSLRIVSRSSAVLNTLEFGGKMEVIIRFECRLLTAPIGTVFDGIVRLSNKMGLTVVNLMDRDPIRVMLPRELHLKENTEMFNAKKVGDRIKVKVLKSKHGVGDNYLTAVGIMVVNK